MKRGKDVEKIMGPMFPRLHVNDAEKGGPRAPPRNKMALYEQLSIPSQRFNSGVMPLNPKSTSNSVPPGSSSQGGGNERGTFFPLQRPSSMHPSEKINNCYSDLNNQLEQEEDDFWVPIFVQSGIGQDRGVIHHNRDKESLSPFTSAYSGRLAKLQNASEKDPKRTDPREINSRQEGVSQSIENSQEFVAAIEKLVKSASNQSSRPNTKGPLKQSDASSSFSLRDSASKESSRLQNNGNLRLGYGVESQPDNTVWGDSVSNETVRVIDYGNSSAIAIRDVQQEVLSSPNDPTNGDAVSETSMVDSISGIDISPDDVVGIIGQKHFWKARRAIVNQQRVFAVQVFELHRLIKVQRLIAESPHLLLEDNAYLGKPLKVSPTKKLSLEYIVNSSPNISKQRDDCEKPNDNVEFSAENAVGKVSLSSVQNGSHPSNYRPFSGNPLPTADPKMGSWNFNQPPGHQWLIPVMSPSEGLVYKPYPGPGFMSPVCGGCGPPGSTPLMGHNFVNYGVPASHHHYQGHGVSPFAPPPSHGYFPPFGMPLMSPSISSSAGEQMNHFNMQYQSSCNAPSEKNEEAVSNVGKFHASKDSEIQVSTASSPSERLRGRNALTLFPTSPVIQLPDGGGPQPCEADQPARVIKVVPHNARSATESVARIFQSIQEERKQYDSVSTGNDHDFIQN